MSTYSPHRGTRAESILLEVKVYSIEDLIFAIDWYKPITAEDLVIENYSAKGYSKYIVCAPNNGGVYGFIDSVDGDLNKLLKL